MNVNLEKCTLIVCISLQNEIIYNHNDIFNIPLFVFVVHVFNTKHSRIPSCLRNTPAERNDKLVKVPTRHHFPLSSR